MKEKVSLRTRKSAFVELKDFCTFSVGLQRKDKGDFLEVTEWTNCEGYDVVVHGVDGEKTFQLTWGQVEALKKCIKAIEESYEQV